MPRRWHSAFLVMLAITVAGCGEVEVVPARPFVEEPVVEAVEYMNDRFGYRFAVPRGAAVYGIDMADQSAAPATSKEEIVFVPGEGTNYLTLRAVETSLTAHEWLTANLVFFYPTGEAAQKIDQVDGRLAIFLRGEGTTESPARLLVVQGEGSLLILTYERDDPTFESMVASLGFH